MVQLFSDKEMQKTVPASIMLFLFADKLVPTDSAFSAGTLISYSKKTVKTNELATLLLAFTLWDLFHKNYIILDIQKTKKMFFIPSEKLNISIKKDIPVQGDLENLLIRDIEGSYEEVKKRIHKLLKTDQVWPHKTIINIVTNNTCDIGIGKIKEASNPKEKLVNIFSGNIDFEAEIGSVSALESEFNLIFQQWNQFNLSSSKIAGMLLNSCRAGLNSRLVQYD